ncbi:hypothetical protein LB553_01005 [Mesorhizobium sp. CA8]|uniref:hypothetical protein n=1 Tax=Mesorhizobium sp. CA8 TaxID=2876637 RepID=UPI001CCCEEBA|nr:hypothetical protein [Mesorhizobium sp. CA8]MBZ9759466.1 hypothetical protein [Mesorhizobium sp. CA8]
MNYTAITEITRMLNAFPTSKSDPDLTLDTFEMATSGLSSQAVIEAAQRYTMGEVHGQTKTFAPSVAEFVTEARQRQEYIELKAKPRLPAPRYFPGPLAPFQVRQEKRRAENADRQVIEANVPLDRFVALSRAKQLPVGAVWVATMGILGPAPKEQTIIKGGT